MANHYWLTQYSICDTKDEGNFSEIRIDEQDLLKLLRLHWPATTAPQLEQSYWVYRLKTSVNQDDCIEISLHNHLMISDLRFKKSEWVQLCKVLQDYLGQTIFLSNDSNPESCLIITHQTVDEEILQWLEHH